MRTSRREPKAGHRPALRTRSAICVTLAALAPSKIFACAACYASGATIDDRMADGMNWAILTLGVVIATVLGGFLTFLVYAIRKSEAVEAERVKAAAAPATQAVFALTPSTGLNQKLKTETPKFA